MMIDGRTRPAGVVGWPVEHSLSPAMHNAAYESLGLNWVYLGFPAPDQNALLRLADAARSLPFVGFNVTMPHKQAMLELCDEVAMLAQMAGAVNTVHCVDGRLVGYNTDSRGLLESIEAEAHFSSEGRRRCNHRRGWCGRCCGRGFHTREGGASHDREPRHVRARNSFWLASSATFAASKYDWIQSNRGPSRPSARPISSSTQRRSA